MVWLKANSCLVVEVLSHTKGKIGRNRAHLIFGSTRLFGTPFLAYLLPSGAIFRKNMSESVRCPRSWQISAQKLSEVWVCPNILRTLTIVIMLFMPNIWYPIYFECFILFGFDQIIIFQTKTLNLTLFERKLPGYCVCPTLSEKISYCPSEYRIGVRTISEFRNFGLQLAPLLLTLLFGAARGFGIEFLGVIPFKSEMIQLISGGSYFESVLNLTEKHCIIWA